MTHSLPTGYYRDSENYLYSTQIFPHNWIVDTGLGNKIHMLFKDPIGIENQVPHELLVSRGNGLVTEQGGTIYTIPHGRLCLERGYVISHDNKLIWDYHRGDNQIPQEHPIFKLPHLPPISESYPIVVSLVNHVSGAYYHWLLDVLPLLHMLETRGIHPDKYVISPDVRSFVYPTFEMFGISRDQVIVCHENMHIQAERLMIPHLTYTHRSKWMVNYLVKHFIKNKEIQPDSNLKRIYISRSKAAYRHVLNEDELLDQVLNQYGFQKIILEELSIEDQVRAFYSADTIVSPHGSGLANLVFSKPGTKVIEMFSAVYIRPFFVELSNVLDLQHYYIVGKKTEDSRTEHDNMHIDLNELREVLHLAGISD